MDTTTPQSPSYRIFRDQHGIPQFEPRRGSRALKDALAYAFPTLETEMQLMQAALKKFFDSERGGGGSGSSFICELPENNLQLSIAKRKEIDSSFAAESRPFRSRKSSRTSSQVPSLASSRAPSRASSRCETPVSFVASTFEGGVMTTWMLGSGRELEKRKKMPYDAAKRRRVAENRGNTCEKHRIAKTACDPEVCPQNKLYGKMQKEKLGLTDEMSPDSQSGSANASTPGAIESGNMEYSIQSSSASTPNPAFAAEDINPWNEQNPLFASFQTQQTPSSTEDTMANSLTLSNSLTWAQPMPNNTMTQSYPPLLHPQSHSTHQHSLFTFNEEPAFNEDPMETLSAPLLEENLMSLPPLEGDFTCAVDPFMGWGNKRDSQVQTFDDYGWVLDHVGTL